MISERRARFTKLSAAGFALVTATSASAGLLGFLLSHSSRAAAEATAESHRQDLTLALEAQLESERMVSAARGYLLTRSPDRLTRMEAAERRFSSKLASLGSDPSERSKDLAQTARNAADRYSSELRRQVSAPEPETPMDITERLANEREELDRATRDLLDFERERARDTSRDWVRVRHSATVVASLIAVVGTLGASVMAARFHRRLTMHYTNEERAHERARHESQARQEMLGIVAHDLRTPLSSIALAAGTLRGTSSDPGSIRAAGIVERQAAAMARLIETLLDATYVETGRFSLKMETVRIETLLANCVDAFEASASHSGVELETDAEPGLEARADAGALGRVLENLVGNALRFTPEGGRVRLRATQSPSGVRLSVSDSGPGIPAGQADRIFERFWSGSPRRQGGVGLGLFIARALVEAHGGSIWVRNEAGGGATFELEIPRASEPHPAAQRPDAHAPIS